MFRLCCTEFESNRYKAVRQHLYLFSDGTLKHRQFIALSEVSAVEITLRWYTMKPKNICRHAYWSTCHSHIYIQLP